MKRDRDKAADGAADIAIIGMGCRFPGSPDLPSFWRTVRDRKVWAAPVPKSRWDHALFYSENGAREHNKTYAQQLALIDRVEEFDPDHFGITPRRAKVMDPQQRLFLDVVRMAMEDAGYESRKFPRDRTGVFVGATVSDFMDILITRMKATLLAGGEFGHGLQPTEEAWKALTKDLAPLQAYSLVGTLMNMVAANVNQCFDFGGPAFTMDAACSSALVALHEAVLHLRGGLCDAAVVGGVYLILAPDNVVAFSRIGAISPSDSCRPFDRRADGFVIGEGLGAVILRRLPEALAAGDHIYAVIRGVGMNNDGKAEGPMTPRKEGQIAVLERAYADAGVSPLSIDFIEAHGTATPVGDATEVAALYEHRGRAGERPCLLSSVKANVGHSMSAAGIAGLIRAALSVDRRVLTAQAGYGQQRDDLSLGERGFVVPDATTEWTAPSSHPRRAGVNSFGFGGTNVHVVLEEAPPTGTRPRVQVAVPIGAPGGIDAALKGGDEERWPELFVLSAPNPALLREQAGDLRAAIADNPDLDVERIAYTLSLRRTAAVRASFVAATREELHTCLSALVDGEDGAAPAVHLAKSSGTDHEDAIAFLFPGQGAQAPGLCLDLYQRFPAFRRALDELAGPLRDGERPLLTYLYPSNGARQTAMSDLTRTEICQPIMAAIGLSVARLCRAVGINPAVVTGHSLGEFAAAAGAGIFSDDDAVALVAERGRLIAGLPLADRGTMAAVAADRAQVGKHLAGLADVAIANMNHPSQTVISGTHAGVDRALERLEKAGLKFKRLSVSHAFHSPLMADLREPFEARLENTTVRPGVLPVVSAVAPGPYPVDAAAVRELLAEHATRPVDFAGALRVVGEHGARVFLQMGGGSALATMARLTLSAVVPDGLYLTAAGDAPDRGRTFLQVLAALFVRGAALQLAPLFEDRSLAPVTLPASLLETRPLWPVKSDEIHAALPFGDAATTGGSTGAPHDPSRDRADNRSEERLPEGRLHQGSQEWPAGGDSAGRPSADSLAALFGRQMALLDAQITIIEQQNRLLQAAGVQVPNVDHGALRTALRANNTNNGSPTATTRPASMSIPGATSVPIPGAAPAATATGSGSGNGESHKWSVPEIERAVIDAAARITAQDTTRLAPGTRLGTDLGFDSLMVVELSSALAETYPGLELPRSLFTRDLSIADLARSILPLLSSAQADGDQARLVADGEGKPFQRYAIVLEPRERPALRGEVAGRVLLIASDDRPELAGAVKDALARRRIEARIVNALSDDAQAARVVDLRGVGVPLPIARVALAKAGDFRAPLQRALATARAADRAGRRPAHLYLVHTGDLSVGLEGFAKALAREWDDVVVRSIEVPAEATAATLADVVAEEIVCGDAAVEIRYRMGRQGPGAHAPAPLTRFAPQATMSALAPPRTASFLDGAAGIISGGARGLGAKLARALAHAHKARLAILGRGVGGPDVDQLIAEIRAAGGYALYLSCDVRDDQAVAAAVTRAREQIGPLTFAVHAAGVVEDAAIGQKSDESFARVFDTKVAGGLNLWNALAPDPLRAFVALGSFAGRFGNSHQLDYAAANNTLARLAEPLSTARPDVRVAVLDLPPWQGGGMIDALPEAARKLLGTRIRFLTDEEGLPGVLAELDAAPSGEALLSSGTPVDERALLFERVIAPASDLESAPVDAAPGTITYLDDHMIAGRRVLPLAGAVDLWIEAGRALWAGTATVNGAAKPEGAAPLSGFSLLDVAVLDGVVVGDDRGRVSVSAHGPADGPLRVTVGLGAGGKGLRARLSRLRSARGLAATDGSRAPGSSVPREAAPPLARFYAEHTFHGPGLRALETIDELSPAHARATLVARPVTGGTPLVTALDGVLQLFAYHSVWQSGRGGLPLSADEIHVHRIPRADERLHCHAVLIPEQSQPAGADRNHMSGDADLIDTDGRLVLQLRGLHAEVRAIGAAVVATGATEAAGATVPAGTGPAPTLTDPSVASGAETAAPDPAIPSERYRPEEWPEVKALEQRLHLAKVMGIANPYFRSHEGVNAATARVKGRTLINFSSYNYLGLSGHPEVNRAVKDAVDRFGSSVSASRIASGERPLHQELEAGIADFVGCESSIVMVGGHATNVSVIGHVLGPEDLVVHDSLAHDSIVGGARLSGARRRPFAHNDPDALERILRETRAGVRRVLVAIEGVYSMDGDIAPLPEVIALKKRYGALLLVDEAHSIGVLGNTGRGVGEYHGVAPSDVDMWMGTLSKSFSSCGGYIGGSARLVQYLRYSVPGFVYSVGISPANAAAALASLRLMQAHPELPRLLHDRSRFFLRLCRERGIDTGMSRDSAVVPCIVRNSYACLQLSQALEARGINVQPILFPAVEETQARLRFFISVTHSEEQLTTTADILAEELARLLPGGPAKRAAPAVSQPPSTGVDSSAEPQP